MSQLKQYDEMDPYETKIASISDLIQIFIKAQKLPEHYWVGVEHEKFAFDLKTHLPLDFWGNPGIHELLLKLKNFGEMSQLFEDGNLIALSDGQASISLEPGGQVELSGKPCRTLYEIDKELSQYEEVSSKAASLLGIGFLPMGYHPTAFRGEIPWMPKERYQIMKAYMPKVGSRGLDMMLRTCTVQANMDYENEQNMVSSVQTAFAISPIVTALFANSPFAEGKPTGFLCERVRVWRNTDQQRCGFPSIIFQKDFGFEKWIQFVLDVPMYFIRRGGHYIDVAGASFRKFMKEGLLGEKASIRDFADHLTTIFTEVRIKPQIELRSADVGPPEFLRALPAFWKGILYDENAKKKAYSLMQEPSAQELNQLQMNIAKEGFSAQYRGKNVLALAECVLEISREGLLSQSKKKSQLKGEEKFLLPLFKVVEQKETLAEKCLKLYKTKWQENIDKVFL